MSPVNVKEMAKVPKHCVNQVSKALITPRLKFLKVTGPRE